MVNKIVNLLRYYGLVDSPSPRLYWWTKRNTKNFGDLLGPYIFKKITNKSPQRCDKNCLREYYASVGSILNVTNKNAIVWGAGIISNNKSVRKPMKVCAVRGPITRKKLLDLGYDCPKIYGDPALLLPKLYKPVVKKKFEIGIIPHYVDYKRIKSEVKDSKVLIINLFDSVEKVIDDIVSCKRTISSSLHGLIVSHSYKVPSVWVKFSDDLAGDDVKFKDYFLSVQIKPYAFFDLRNKSLTFADLKYISLKRNDKIKFNSKKLFNACPFDKSYFLNLK